MTIDAETTRATFERLKHSLQALALNADLQCNLFPDFVCKADELALDFDHWHLCVTTNLKDDLNETQNAKLSVLDNFLNQVSGPANADYWTEEALHFRPEWEQIRVLALDALDAFGWSLETPPSYVGEFVPGRS